MHKINKLFYVWFSGKLEDVLKHYETLHANEIFHGLHKRDVNTQEKVVSFTTLGRQVNHSKIKLLLDCFSFDCHETKIKAIK